MLKTILFDLDGTLLPMDLHHFLTNYFGRLTKSCAHVLDPEALHKHIWASTEAMIRDNRPDKTNQQVFLEDFVPRFNLPAEACLYLTAQGNNFINGANLVIDRGMTSKMIYEP
ncbi:MAG: hypothetical protein M1119_09865 [Firmicutes bacterium]|nr:hypothetical protein [Bacillota bacterium]